MLRQFHDFIQAPEKEIREEIITDWNVDADDEICFHFNMENDLTTGFWDGKSADARLGMLFPDRKALKEFMALYKEDQNCQYCVLSGGVSEQCTSKKVNLPKSNCKCVFVFNNTTSLVLMYTYYLLRSTITSLQ